MSGITIEIASSLADLAGPWADLVQRADGNVFFDPAALKAVEATGFARLQVLLAWDHESQPASLIGLWALGEARLSVLGPRILAAPAYEYAFVSGPVIDPACLDAVVAAFLDALASHPRLPKVLALKYLDGDAPATAALLSALAARPGRLRVLKERARPYASKESGQKASGSTRKKLRQDWNRLSATGIADVVNERDPATVEAAFEAFLALEMASWKGANRTALLSTPTDAVFARRLIHDLAREGKASVALLRLNGQPVAAQVLLYCGSTAYTWKTAFDAAFARFSPGSLLVNRATEDLFVSGFTGIESCSPEGGFMAQMWSGHRTSIDLIATVGGPLSLGYTMAAAHERGRAHLKRLRNTWRSRTWPSFPRKKAAAAG